MSEAFVLLRDHFDDLLRALAQKGYRVIGPTLKDGAIVYSEIERAADLPEGWTDVQEAGRYRLERRNDRALFGYAVGPHSWKKYLYPPVLTLWRAQRKDSRLEVRPADDPPPRYAFLGVRACELRAMEIHDRVLKDGEFSDRSYVERRRQAFVVAVQCGKAGGTCFCVSMNAGPRADRGYDLALTELLSEGRHEFLVEAGTEEGAAILKDVRHSRASQDHRDRAVAVVEKTAASMGRTLETDGIRDLLARHLDHPRWEEVAKRCLTCANRTMVCPTCFCTSVDDTTDLTGEVATHTRRWDSCFTLDFSYIHGGSVRPSVPGRYRQWLTHKLGTWFDQFGSSGCVGCGRCITWCPTGIDITEEARAIRESETTPCKP